ncbi:DUF6993 domain-containing protein [Cellulosimicrobium sp. NPDC057862]|uniref:DUF6993 domain-containing protein n=1 Tax=Cellulosimicrobium sp. NPDC057862 TaxID=3346266 RepID=UPI003670857D
MATPDPDDLGPDGTSRLGRAVVGVVVGIAIFAFVGVVGYFLFMSYAMQQWANSYDSSQPQVTVTAEDTNAVEHGTGLDASNEAYRQRMGTPEDHAEAALSVPAVQAALEPLADGSAVTGDEVWDTLVAAGYEHVQVSDKNASGDLVPVVGVGVGVPGGCVYGAVAPDAVTLDAGGPIADGGCLEMPSH